MSKSQYYLLLAGLMTFCSPKESDQGSYLTPVESKELAAIDSVTLVPTERIAISIDQETSYTTENIQYFRDSVDQYLITENQNRNSVDIYSLTTKTLVKTVTFEKTGRRGIKMKGFHFHNFDSIFVFPQYTLFGTLLADSTGRIQEKYFDDEPRFVMHHTSKTRMPTFYKDGSIYSLVVPNDDFRKKSFFSIKDGLEVKLDLNEGLGYLDVKYPTSYADHTWGVTHAIPCRIYDSENERFIYSYGIDPYLYVFDSNGELVSKHNAPSKHIDAIDPLDDPSAAKDENLNYLLDEPYYGDIFYDQYRKVYYRIAKHPVKRPERIWENKPISIIILDENFRKIGEKDLEPLTEYYARDFFISEDGFYISNNHPLNENMNEDLMLFTKFELEPIGGLAER